MFRVPSSWANDGNRSNGGPLTMIGLSLKLIWRGLKIRGAFLFWKFKFVVTFNFTTITQGIPLVGRTSQSETRSIAVFGQRRSRTGGKRMWGCNCHSNRLSRIRKGSKSVRHPGCLNRRFAPNQPSLLPSKTFQFLLQTVPLFGQTLCA